MRSGYYQAIIGAPWSSLELEIIDEEEDNQIHINPLTNFIMLGECISIACSYFDCFGHLAGIFGENRIKEMLVRAF